MTKPGWTHILVSVKSYTILKALAEADDLPIWRVLKFLMDGDKPALSRLVSKLNQPAKAPLCDLCSRWSADFLNHKEQHLEGRTLNICKGCHTRLHTSKVKLNA